MNIAKLFFGNKKIEPMQPGPYSVTRYWRELDEEITLGICRTQEEAVQVIRKDQEQFDQKFIRENLFYSVDPAWELK